MEFEDLKYEDLSDECKQVLKSGTEMLNYMNRKNKELRIMSTKYLSRQTILTADDIKAEEVDVPEWGGKVLIKAMTGTQRDAFEASIVDYSSNTKNPKMKLDNARAKLLVKTIVDEDLNPIFTAADIEALGLKSAAAMDRCYAVASRLSKISPEDVEELTKNLPTDQQDTSTIN